MFLPNLFCISEVSDDVHQGIAACTSLVFFSWAHIFTCGSLFFLSVWFRSLRFGASNEFIFLRVCFVWLVRTLGFGCFCSEFFFFFCALFTYLEHFYLRCFSYAVFISAWFHLRYCNVLCCMRFSQFLHLMLQWVEWFGFPSILTRSTDTFQSILDFSMSIVFLCLQ